MGLVRHKQAVGMLASILLLFSSLGSVRICEDQLVPRLIKLPGGRKINCIASR